MTLPGHGIRQDSLRATLPFLPSSYTLFESIITRLGTADSSCPALSLNQ
jgi:hypothetical protein